MAGKLSLDDFPSCKDIRSLHNAAICSVERHETPFGCLLSFPMVTADVCRGVAVESFLSEQLVPWCSQVHSKQGLQCDVMEQYTEEARHIGTDSTDCVVLATK